ncbi:MAG: glycosyltransferase family 2 protein [Acidobacteria bacterium]|nr:glycosyltransferase family 2 protein [Acidobacteriota bacterium]
MHPSVSILVLNYNGLAHLDDCLRSLLRAASAYAGPCAVVCVDNRSTDGSRAFVRERYRSVEVIEAPANDFLFSLNAVVAAREEEIVIVVNNDMRFDENFVGPLAAHFANPEVFAAGAAIFDWAGASHTVGPRCARLRQFWFHKWWRCDRQQTALTLEACGGAAAYRRPMFVELGGFDPLFRPGYYEDLDLSYRAWGRGWSVVYEPRSRAYHRESASMLARFGDTAKARLLYRNHLLFTVKNIGGAAFLAGFFLCLPYRVLSPLLRGYQVPLRGFLQALPKLPLALRKRLARVDPPPDLSRFEQVTPLAVPPVARA